MAPGIECVFTLGKDKITLITLQVGVKEGIHWSIAPHGAPALARLVGEWMDIYLSGRQPDIRLPLDFKGVTSFTLQVLHQMQTVPFGGTLSYCDIAERLGKPLASRAVGGACGRNPFPLVIPCHRILAKGGGIGGFSCGLPVKSVLLAHEGIVPSRS